MILGKAYPYERVVTDSGRYEQISADGKFLGWWEPYFRDEGLQNVYRPFLDLYDLPRFSGKVVGILGWTLHSKHMRHVVVVDELGIVDPADDAPDHIDIAEYILSRRTQGVVFDEDFLAIQLPQ